MMSGINWFSMFLTFDIPVLFQKFLKEAKYSKNNTDWLNMLKQNFIRFISLYKYLYAIKIHYSPSHYIVIHCKSCKILAIACLYSVLYSTIPNYMMWLSFLLCVKFFLTLQECRLQNRVVLCAFSSSLYLERCFGEFRWKCKV